MFLQLLLGDCGSCQLRCNDLFNVRYTAGTSNHENAADFHVRRNFIRQQFMRKLQRRGINQSRKKRQAKQEYETEQKQR